MLINQLYNVGRRPYSSGIVTGIHWVLESSFYQKSLVRRGSGWGRGGAVSV